MLEELGNVPMVATEMASILEIQTDVRMIAFSSGPNPDAQASCLAEPAPMSNPGGTLFQPSARRDGPEGLHAAAADADDFLMQMHCGIGIADDEFNAVTDPRTLAR